MLASLFVVLDGLSATAMLALGLAFARLWRLSNDALHVLFAIAFGSLAAGISLVGASEFDLTRSALLIDGARILFHTAAPLMLAMGYAAARRDKPVSVVGTVGIAYLLAAALTALIWVLPPTGEFGVPTPRNAFLVAHFLQFALYLAIVVLSARSFLRGPTWRRALVPLGFTAYAFSKYTWLLIDATDAQELVPLIYVWRFMMLALLTSALVAPFLRGEPDATT